MAGYPPDTRQESERSLAQQPRWDARHPRVLIAPLRAKRHVIARM